jgi:hypothetical protein
MTVNKTPPDGYEARVLNALMEPAAKKRAYYKLGKHQESKGWVFSQETGEYNLVSAEEEFERDLFFDLAGKLVAILASDKKGAAGSVEDLLNLAENDADGFNNLYRIAIEANPSLAEKEPVGGADPDPNE